MCDIEWTTRRLWSPSGVRAAERFREEFEERIVGLEARAVLSELEHSEYMETLKHILVHREEQLQVANEEVKKRDQ